MEFENKEQIAVFIERHIKELGGEAYGVPYIAEKLWQWHEQQVKSVDLAQVGGSLHTKTCKVVNDNDDEFPCDVTTCCGVGPITGENYCPNCGAKIERQ